MKATRVLVVTLGVLISAGGAAAGEPDKAGLSPQQAETDTTAVAIQMAPSTALAEVPAATPEEPVELAVCEPEIVDSRPALNPSCLNLIVDINKRGNRIDASTRKKKEMRSLCDSMWLPRCRHKY